MLPSSHRAPRNVAGVSEFLSDGPPGVLPAMLPTGPDRVEAPVEASVLADAFSEFIAAAARLEGSYSELQQQVAHLNTELAERNAALNASLAENERMRRALVQIVDSMPCGVLVVENDGQLTMINPEGMRLLDLDLARMQAESRMRNILALSRHAGIDLASFVADERVAEGDQEFSVASRSGKRWIEVRNRRIYADPSTEGRIEAGPLCRQTILILRDVTAHKQAEEERERARRATALAEVAAMLAHEIRNPLASLELFAGLIATSESLTNADGSELCWIEHMRAGIRSLSGTVNNVLSFHGAGFPVLAALSLSDAIGSSVEFVRPIAEQARVALYFECEPGAIAVLGNASGLQQLVLNLVSNAVRHTGKGGSVWVRVRAPEARPGTGAGRVQVEFSDTGSGIRPEQLTEIFRPGFSGSGNTSGLGLAVCGQIVRQHGGEMRVSSKVGRGTTFYVELPTL